MYAAANFIASLSSSGLGLSSHYCSLYMLLQGLLTPHNQGLNLLSRHRELSSKIDEDQLQYFVGSIPQPTKPDFCLFQPHMQFYGCQWSFHGLRFSHAWSFNIMGVPGGGGGPPLGLNLVLPSPPPPPLLAEPAD